MNVKRLKKEDTVLVVIDFQERLVPAMKNGEETVAAAAMLIRGCRMLGVPALVTQQYTKGLGETVAPIREALAEASGDPAREASYQAIEKKCFSAAGTEDFLARMKAFDRKTVLLCGIETHVCVLQTALDLLEAGFDVFVAGDCVDSRRKRDRKVGISRMTSAGAVSTTAESALFELLGGADAAEFKQISKLVK